MRGILKVVAAKPRKAAIVVDGNQNWDDWAEVLTSKEKEMDDSYEAQARRHDERMKEVYAQRAADVAAKEARYAEAFANPPTLSGSEKQIAWASKIRGAFIEFYQVRRREYCGDEVLSHTDAKYWIENRYGMGVTNADQRAIQDLMYRK